MSCASILLGLALMSGALKAPEIKVPQIVELAPRVIAHIDDSEVTESSGVVASRLNSGIYWTHNDSDDGPFLFAFDRTGKSYGRWTVTGATNVDWEDLATGPAENGSWNIYIGDIGDNPYVRKGIVVYRVPEPTVDATRDCREGCKTQPATAYHLQYPDGPHNSETLLVHPTTGDVYIISKASSEDPVTTVFVARAAELGEKTVTLTKIATLNIPDRLTRRLVGGVTSGEISADGRKVALCDYLHYYEVAIPAGADFDSVWKQTFYPKLLGVVGQVEGVTYRTDGKALILTGEGVPSPIIEIPIE